MVCICDSSFLLHPQSQDGYICTARPCFCKLLVFSQEKVIPSLLCFEIQKKLNFSVCNVVFIVAFFKGGKMDSHCVYFGHRKYLNHFHLLGTGPASVKILFLTKIHLLAARHSVPMEKHGCHGKLRSWREKQVL